MVCRFRSNPEQLKQTAFQFLLHKAHTQLEAVTRKSFKLFALTFDVNPENYIEKKKSIIFQYSGSRVRGKIFGEIAAISGEGAM